MSCRTLLSPCAALLFASVSVSAFAQTSFPTRDITFIVPWNAGGSNDVMARALQPILKEQGFSIVIENVTGATGTIGMRRVAASEPDGYTLGMGTSSTLALIAQGKTPLKNEQFTHIVRVSIDPLMLLVPAKGPSQTLDGFIDYMKKNPGKVSIGTPGAYNVNHIFAAMTARAAGVSFINVPYTGGSKVVGDLIGGHLDAGTLKPSETLPQVMDNLIKPLGVFADKRLPSLPDVPTFKEKGYDVFPFGPIVQMAYVAGPANMPADVSKRLSEAFRTAILDPRFKSVADINSFLIDPITDDALTKEVVANGAALQAVVERVLPKEN